MFERMGKSGGKCLICQKVYKTKEGTTTTLMRHAKQAHPSHLKDLQEKAKHAQPTLHQVLDKTADKYPRGSTRKQQLDDTLITMIAQDLQPVSIVEDAGFLKFCGALDKKYQVPTRKHVRNVLLPAKFEKVQGQVKDKIRLAEVVSITGDLWTSTTNSSFLSITCHWWDPKTDKLDSAILDCNRVEGRHTAAMIQEEVEKVLEDYTIKDKILTVVSDNGANVVRAVKDMGYRRLPCFAHSLNLVVTDSIKAVPKVQDARDKVSRVVKLTRQSTVAKEKLDKIQVSLGLTPKKLIQDVPTRWNSLYEMFQRFLDLKDAVTLLLAQPGLDKDMLPLSSSTWDDIDQAVKLLKPCYEATVELSGEKVSTGSKVIPLSKVLMANYAAAERESEEGSTRKELAHHILRNLNWRFEDVEDVRILAMATLVDPR